MKNYEELTNLQKKIITEGENEQIPVLPRVKLVVYQDTTSSSRPNLSEMSEKEKSNSIQEFISNLKNKIKEFSALDVDLQSSLTNTEQQRLQGEGEGFVSIKEIFDKHFEAKKAQLDLLLDSTQSEIEAFTKNLSYSTENDNTIKEFQQELQKTSNLLKQEKQKSLEYEKNWKSALIELKELEMTIDCKEADVQDLRNKERNLENAEKTKAKLKKNMDKLGKYCNTLTNIRHDAGEAQKCFDLERKKLENEIQVLKKQASTEQEKKMALLTELETLRETKFIKHDPEIIPVQKTSSFIRLVDSNKILKDQLQSITNQNQQLQEDYRKILMELVIITNLFLYTNHN